MKLIKKMMFATVFAVLSLALFSCNTDSDNEELANPEAMELKFEAGWWHVTTSFGYENNELVYRNNEYYDYYEEGYSNASLELSKSENSDWETTICDKNETNLLWTNIQGMYARGYADVFEKKSPSKELLNNAKNVLMNKNKYSEDELYTKLGLPTGIFE